MKNIITNYEFDMKKYLKNYSWRWKILEEKHNKNNLLLNYNLNKKK